MRYSGYRRYRSRDRPSYFHRHPHQGDISRSCLDKLVYLHAKSHNGDINPESRLYATIPGAILIPIGVIIEGLCFQFKTHYMGPVMGIAVAAVGLQIVTTNIYAYITDVSLSLPGTSRHEEC